MHTINHKVTSDEKYRIAKEAIRTMNSLVSKNRNPDKIVSDVYLFEDLMNGLAGYILGFEEDLYQEIRSDCQQLVDVAAKKNITISLYEKLLIPKEKPSNNNIERRTAKKLYPLTTSVQVSNGVILTGETDQFGRLDTDINANRISGATSGRTSGVSDASLSSTINSTERNIKQILNDVADKVKSKNSLLGLTARSGVNSDLINENINRQISEELLASGDISSSLLADLDQYSKTGDKSTLREIQNVSDEELNNLISALNGNGVVALSLEIPPLEIPPSVVANVGGVGVITLAGTTAVGTAAEAGDDIDPNFELLDQLAEEFGTTYEQTPLVLLEDETEDYLPLIPEELRDLVEAAATNSAGLQAGMATFFSNPLADTITATKNLLLQYTDNNFQGLNTAVGGSATGTSYGMYQDALGGGDGLGGAVAQLDAFKDHTDRLSGLVLDDSSENAESVSDNTTEDKFYYDVPVNVKTAIMSFNAKKFRSAKYYVQSTAALGTSLSANTEHQTTELFVLHDNRKVYFREVFTNYTIDPFSTFTAELTSGNVVVSVTSTLANTNYVIHGVKLRIAANTDSYEKMSLIKILRTHYEVDAYYDEDGEYASEMAGSLFKRDLVDALYEEVQQTVKNVKSGGNALSAAASIKSKTAALQASIDSDYAAYKKYSKIAETLNTVDEVQKFYLVPTTKPILDLILNTSTKSTLETEVDSIEDPPEEPIVEFTENDEEAEEAEE